MDVTKVIVGFGTGRCGTQSLAAFLDLQPGWEVSHEQVPLGWYQAFTDTEIAIREFLGRKGRVIGDIGYYWINYLDLILRKIPNAKAINIVRDDDKVIESFWSYMNPKLQSFEHNDWKGYPYDSPDQTKDAIVKTVRRYRFLEHEVRKIYPASIFVMKTEDLNDNDKLNELLDWLESDTFRVLRPVHTNTREQILSKNARQTERLDLIRRS